MALHTSLQINCSTLCRKEDRRLNSTISSLHSLPLRLWITRCSSSKPLMMISSSFSSQRCRLWANGKVLRVSKAIELVLGNRNDDDDDESESDENDKDSKPLLMSNAEREEMRRKIREVLDQCPDVEEESDPVKRKLKMEKLLAEYPLIVEEEDPDWPEDADGRGFNLDQFFDKITIKNKKKENDDEDEGYDSENEIVWQDDNYIKPVRDIRAVDWFDTVFKDFNPLIILVHHRYKRPRDNERARNELERAVQMFWKSGLPSPRCVAIDACVEHELVEALQVTKFPEIIFTKAGKILHRDKVVRSADDWSKIMAFFYYKAVRPTCLDKSIVQSQEKIPSL